MGTYKNRTMVGNWWEDRLMSKDKQVNTSDRVLSRDFAQHDVSMYQTSKQLVEHHMQNCQTSLTTPHKPKMYPCEQTVKDRMSMYMPEGATPAELTYTIGTRSLQQAQTQASERHLQTTNQHFYRDLPQQACSTGAVTSCNPDKTYHIKGSDVTKPKVTPEDLQRKEAGLKGGKGGSRGEITRHPREAGNPYGVSVFVDEYATWGRNKPDAKTDS